MKAIGIWQGGYRTRLEDGRGHAVNVDLDRTEGGEDLGTSALELSVLSLAGCITTIFAIVAKKRRIAFDGMRVELDAERPRGEPTISAVRGTFRILSAAPPEEIQTALDITLRTCPVGVLFHRARIPIHLELRIGSPREPVRATPPLPA